MEFDEYDYLEKTVENPETIQTDKSGDGERSKKHKSDESVVKRSRTNYESNEDEKERSSRHRSSFKREKERSERERYRRRRSSSEYKDRELKIKDKGATTDERESRDKEEENLSHSQRYSGSRNSNTNRDRRFHRDTEYGARDARTDLPERDPDTRRSKEKTEEVAEPQADPERDQRTVFAYQISLKADERDIYEFFSRAGKVRDVRLIIDRASRRSKGVGYVEFYDVMSVPMAIALSGQPLLGHQVMVKPSEAEKNLVQSIASVAAGDIGTVGPCSEGARRLYVGNLHVNIKEDQLRQVFEPFGSVELVQLPSDPKTGHSKGYGFVQFSRLEDARSALSLDGQLDIAGQIMKVSAVTDQTGGQEVGVNAVDFDDDEDGGLSLNAQSRTLLMQKLDHTRITSSGPGPVGSQVVDNAGLPAAAAAAPVLGAASGVSPFVVPFGQIPVPSISGFPAAGLSLPAVSVPSIDTVGFPSECLLLKNMFDPKLESEPEFDQDIKDDVEDECSKFGKLKHIYVDKKSSGFVYLRFENSESASAAQRALHGRWFAGKMITATFMVPKDYEVKFPQSK